MHIEVVKGLYPPLQGRLNCIFKRTGWMVMTIHTSQLPFRFEGRHVPVGRSRLAFRVRPERLRRALVHLHASSPLRLVSNALLCGNAEFGKYCSF